MINISRKRRATSRITKGSFFPFSTGGKKYHAKIMVPLIIDKKKPPIPMLMDIDECKLESLKSSKYLEEEEKRV